MPIKITIEADRAKRGSTTVARMVAEHLRAVGLRVSMRNRDGDAETRTHAEHAACINAMHERNDLIVVEDSGGIVEITALGRPLK